MKNIFTPQLFRIIEILTSIFFVLAVAQLSNIKQAMKGQRMAMLGMIIVLALYIGLYFDPFALAVMLTGGIIGWIVAYKINIKNLPELMAGFHSLVGLCAIFITFAVVLVPWHYGINRHFPWGNKLELILGNIIAGITFSGSVVAFIKLSSIWNLDKFVPRGLILPSLIISILLTCVNAVLFWLYPCICYMMSLAVISSILGFWLIVPISGSNMPVIVSLLNSYSGWAACSVGFSLQAYLLIIVGAVVGASGAILSYVMCKGMNKSITRVILDGFFPASSISNAAAIENDNIKKDLKGLTVSDVADIMKNSSSIIIVPGYGMATSRAQHAIYELYEKLTSMNIEVKFAIHPVAGRMPGHMNVLLAEGKVPDESVFEMEEINGDFPAADLVYVLGANDIINPSAENDPQSAIYGMPILQAYKAHTVVIVKRSSNPGYAGIDNPLFYYDNSFFLFGDAKEVTENLVNEIKK